MSEALKMDWSALERAARAVLPHAHAPYSEFPVAAAVLFSDGGIEAGVNVENASFPLSVCAERNAVAAGVRAGWRRIQAVLVLTSADLPTTPCGGCRQVLAEFGGTHVPVRSLTLQGRSDEHTLGALLPHAFGPTALG